MADQLTTDSEVQTNGSPAEQQPPPKAEPSLEPAPAELSAPPMPPPAPPRRYAASIYPDPSMPLPDEFVSAVRAVEDAIGLQVWLCVQGFSDNKLENITEELVEAFIANEADLPDHPIGLVIHSTGGQARAAYRLATLLQRQCKGFTAIIPRMAKSAATMLALGADKIFLADDAEIGPIDVQIRDPETRGTDFGAGRHASNGSVAQRGAGNGGYVSHFDEAENGQEISDVDAAGISLRRGCHEAAIQEPRHV